VIVYNDKQWRSFFTASGREDLAENPRYTRFAARAQHIDEVYAELARILATQTTADWIARLEKADIPVMPVHDLESLLRDPHLAATDFFEIAEHPTEGSIRSMRVAAEWSETPAVPPRLAPRLGEQSREILSEAGYSEREIDGMIDTGVTQCIESVPPRA